MARELEPEDAGRPRVVVSVGTSVDGRVANRRDHLVFDQPSQPKRSSDVAREAMLEHLYKPRAVLEGSGSFVATDAGPVTGLPSQPDESADALYADFLPDEVLTRPDHENWFTVVDSRGRVRWDSKGGSGGWDLLVLVARATPAEYLAFLRRERISYLVVGAERVDLAVALRRLKDRLGVDCVVSKAGGGLNGALLRAGLIDEIHLRISPTAIGGLGTPALFDGPELAEGEEPTRLRLLFAHVEADGMIWVRYEVVHRDDHHPEAQLA